MVKYLLALLAILPQDCELSQERPGLDTADLATALDSAEKELAEARKDRDQYAEMTYNLKTENERVTCENLLLNWELERCSRERIINTLERVLLTRFIQPYDMWLSNPAAARSPMPRLKDGECWYALVIHPSDPIRSTKLWIKFYLDAKDIIKGEYDGQTNNDIMVWYAKEKRKGLMEVLERHLILSMNDPDCVETIIDGTAHLYRLATKDTDIDKLRKEDRIY